MRMKVVFWCDMEGIAGLHTWEQVTGGNSQHETEGRLLYTEEINAGVRGAVAAGASEIIVVDGHGAGSGYTFNSWIKDRLHPDADYVSGHRWGCYVEPFSSGCDALLMIGAHARAGTPDGVMSHTMSSSTWYHAYLNGNAIGETVLAAGIAGSFGVPLIFVAGDSATARQVKETISPDIATVAVKEGLGRFASRYRAPVKARRMIEEGVREILSNPDRWAKPYAVPSPVELKVEYVTSEKVDQHIGKIGVKVTDERTVISRGDTFWQAWDQFFARS